jgi:hypothetical protein
LFSKLQASIFIIFISFIFAAFVAKIILFSIHFDCHCRVHALLFRVQSYWDWAFSIQNIVLLDVQIFRSYSNWMRWLVLWLMSDWWYEMMLMFEIEILMCSIDREMIFDNSHYFSKSILHNHHDWHFWFCYLRLATSDLWIDKDERIHINRLLCKYLMLMFFADLRTFYSSDLLRKLSRRKFSNRLSNVEISQRKYETLYSFLFISIVYMFSKH